MTTKMNTNGDPTQVAGVPADVGNTASSPAHLRCASLPLLFKQDLYDFAREKARASGETQPNEAQLRALEANAEAMAMEQGATVFDPQANMADKIRKDDHERALAKLGRVEVMVETQAQEVRKRRDAVAELGPSPKIPTMNMFLLAVGAVLIGLTVAGTLHDYFLYGIDDEKLAWGASILGGSAMGAFLAWALAGTSGSTSEFDVLHVLGLAGGIVIGLSLLLVRCVGSQSLDGLLMGAALGVLEIGVVLILESLGKGYRHGYAAFIKSNHEYQRRTAVLTAAETELAKLNAEKEQLNTVINEFVAHVNERDQRAQKVDILAQAARLVVRDGYLAGIADNEAELLHGPKDNTETEDE